MPKTLLLADDSVTIQKVVGISFASEDLELVTVDNGDTAIERARALRPDVVLADVVMPGKNGYEVCEAIKADPSLKHIPVLLLTGTFEAFDEERARRCGAAGHVSKPFEAQSLVQRVRQLLSRPAAVAEPAAAVRPAASAAATPARGAAAAVPTHAPATEPDGFEFFDEEIAELSSPELAPPSASRADDSDFSFGADEFELAPSSAPAHHSAPNTPRGASSRARDPLATAELSSELFEDFDAETADESMSTLAAELIDESEASLLDADPAEDSFAFASPTAAPVTPARSVTAPASIESPPITRHEAAATQIFETPLRAPAALPLARESEPLAWIDADPEASDAFDVSASDLDDSLALDSFSAAAPVASHGSESNFDLDASGSSEPGFDSSAPARDSANSDALRMQLHDTIERAAWEAFGPLSEEIVKQVVQRFEAIAWEIVPQMAEKMISEMLARVSDDADDER
jgi:CheY-like chemotaxis protein